MAAAKVWNVECFAHLVCSMVGESGDLVVSLGFESATTYEENVAAASQMANWSDGVTARRC